jgi:hypothetical protein
MRAESTSRAHIMLPRHRSIIFLMFEDQSFFGENHIEKQTQLGDGVANT